MKNELCVPAGALTKFGPAGADSAGDDAGTAPGVGDEVELTVKGRVTRIEGGNAYIQPESVNDEALPEAGEGDAGEPDADEMMRAEVMTAREKGGMP